MLYCKCDCYFAHAYADGNYAGGYGATWYGQDQRTLFPMGNGTVTATSTTSTSATTPLVQVIGGAVPLVGGLGDWLVSGSFVMGVTFMVPGVLMLML